MHWEFGKTYDYRAFGRKVAEGQAAAGKTDEEVEQAAGLALGRLGAIKRGAVVEPAEACPIAQAINVPEMELRCAGGSWVIAEDKNMERRREMKIQLRGLCAGDAEQLRLLLESAGCVVEMRPSRTGSTCEMKLDAPFMDAFAKKKPTKHAGGRPRAQVEQPSEELVSLRLMSAADALEKLAGMPASEGATLLGVGRSTYFRRVAELREIVKTDPGIKAYLVLDGVR